MKKIDFCQTFGDISEDYVKDAHAAATGAKKRIGIKWGAMAACFCLCALLGTCMWHSGVFGGPTMGGSGVDRGGTVPDGIDPVTASVAVFPAGESLADVADAYSVSISEEDARNVEELGAYLPDALPDGCRYGGASYYVTTMNDGVRYHMLRATYKSGAGTLPAPATEDAQAEPAMTEATGFLWMVWGHRPDTDLPIFKPSDITAQLLEQMDGGVFYIDYDGIYVGISQFDISTEALLAIICTVG